MTALIAALALAVAGPPPASLVAGKLETRLAVSSWCWDGHCGAPIAAAAKTTPVARGSRVAVTLAFVPKRALVSVAGRPMAVTISGRELTWRATRGGGLTVSVSTGKSFVVYVGRIRLR